MRLQQPIADFAHRAAAAFCNGDMVSRRACTAVRVGHRKCQSDRAQQCHIGGVITHVGALRWRYFEPRGQRLKIAQLVATTLDHVADPEFPAAARDGAGTAPRNDGDRNPGAGQQFQSKAVFDIETLQLLAARSVIHPAICEHAIDIQDQQANRRRG